jgi:hypothetical protein
MIQHFPSLLAWPASLRLAPPPQRQLLRMLHYETKNSVHVYMRKYKLFLADVVASREVCDHTDFRLGVTVY